MQGCRFNLDRLFARECKRIQHTLGKTVWFNNNCKNKDGRKNNYNMFDVIDNASNSPAATCSVAAAPDSTPVGCSPSHSPSELASQIRCETAPAKTVQTDYGSTMPTN